MNFFEKAILAFRIRLIWLFPGKEKAKLLKHVRILKDATIGVLNNIDPAELPEPLRVKISRYTSYLEAVEKNIEAGHLNTAQQMLKEMTK